MLVTYLLHNVSLSSGGTFVIKSLIQFVINVICNSARLMHSTVPIKSYQLSLFSHARLNRRCASGINETDYLKTRVYDVMMTSPAT